MDFSLVQDIAAPVDAVDAALVDAAFLARMAELPKLGSAEVLAQERDGDLVRQQVRYLFRADLSRAVTAVVDPDRLTWVEESVCDLAAHHTTCVIKPDHYANLLAGRYEAALTTAGATTRRTISGTITVRMPLLGGKVERAIVSGLGENAIAQTALLTDWLH